MTKIICSNESLGVKSKDHMRWIVIEKFWFESDCQDGFGSNCLERKFEKSLWKRNCPEVRQKILDSYFSNQMIKYQLSYMQLD